MSASLLAELAAIETMMTERAAQKENFGLPAEGIQMHSMPEDPNESVALTSPPIAAMEEDTEVEREHTCAICLVILQYYAQTRLKRQCNTGSVVSQHSCPGEGKEGVFHSLAKVDLTSTPDEGNIERNSV